MLTRAAVIGLLAVVCALTVSVPVHWAHASSTIEIDPKRVQWHRLLFQGIRNLTTVRSEVALSPVTAAQLEHALLAADDVAAETPSARDVMLLTTTVTLTSELPLVDDNGWTTHVWFLPESVSPLQRNRTRIGVESGSKTFRFSPEGVRRLRYEAKGSGDVGRPSPTPAKARSTFFPYGPERADCGSVSDPSLLLYVLSAVDLSPGDPPLELCVFNKKTLHRVQVRAIGSERIQVRYARRRGATEQAVNGEIAAVTVTISARPVEAAAEQAEPFEFFEMRGDIEVSWDPASRLPVRVRGTVGTFGEAAIDLTAADLVR